MSAVEPSKLILTILLILGSKLNVTLFAAMPALICPVVPKNVSVSVAVLNVCEPVLAASPNVPPPPPSVFHLNEVDE